MIKKSVLLITPLFFLTSICLGQIKHSPKYYIAEDGKLYWNKSMPVYLFVSPTPDETGHRLKSKASEKYADPMYLDAEGLNYIRSKYAVDPETGQQVQPQTEIHYEIYADGIPPSTKISLDSATAFNDSKNLFFGPGLTASFKATDETSGIEKVFYSINGGQYRIYDNNPFIINNEGAFTYSFYATDNVGNAEVSNTKSFILDKTPPFTNLNINGLGKENVISENSTMYFLLSDSLSGVKTTYYGYDSSPMKSYTGGKVGVSELEDGPHKIAYYSIDNVGNKEEAKSFSFYLDKSAPLMVSDVLGDKFIVDKKVYFSGRTKLKLTAIDNKIGVKEILYSVDDSEFKTYDQPFYLPSIAGDHEIRYYSVDKLDNTSLKSSSRRGGYERFKHNVSKVYIDLTGPTMKKPTFQGLSTYKSDTLLIGPFSKINLSAHDPESGLKEITYSLNGEITENTYDTAFTIKDEGIHKIEYFGYDNVNNRNTSGVVVFVDATPPEIFAHFTHGELRIADGKPLFSNQVGLFLAATDRKAGLDKIYYSINGQEEKLYDDMIYNFRDNFDFELNIRAIDVLGNESKKTLIFGTRAK